MTTTPLTSQRISVLSRAVARREISLLRRGGATHRVKVDTPSLGGSCVGSPEGRPLGRTKSRSCEFLRIPSSTDTRMPFYLRNLTHGLDAARVIPTSTSVSSMLIRSDSTSSTRLARKRRPQARRVDSGTAHLCGESCAHTNASTEPRDEGAEAARRSLGFV